MLLRNDKERENSLEVMIEIALEVLVFWIGAAAKSRFSCGHLTRCIYLVSLFPQSDRPGSTYSIFPLVEKFRRVEGHEFPWGFWGHVSAEMF